MHFDTQKPLPLYTTHEGRRRLNFGWETKESDIAFMPVYVPDEDNFLYTRQPQGAYIIIPDVFKKVGCHKSRCQLTSYQTLKEESYPFVELMLYILYCNQ